MNDNEKKTAAFFRALCEKRKLSSIPGSPKSVSEPSDPAAAAKHYVRIVDESGEDYLYPEEYFVPVDIPKVAEKVFQQAS